MNFLKNLNYHYNILYCSYFLEKNGKILYQPTNRYYPYLCLIKKIKYASLINFPSLYGKNEDEIVNKLLLISYLKKMKFKYIEIDKNSIFLYNNEIKNIEDIILNLHNMENSPENDSENIYNLKKITLQFILKRLLTSKKISDENIFIEIFYSYIMNTITHKYLTKYHVDINNIPNYRELFKLLKKFGFVDLYYNKYVPYILKNYKKIYKEIQKIQDTNELRKIYRKKLKNFNDINIFKLIDKDVINSYNKTYIKNKFIELSKKYNI